MFTKLKVIILQYVQIMSIILKEKKIKVKHTLERLIFKLRPTYQEEASHETMEGRTFYEQAAVSTTVGASLAHSSTVCEVGSGTR